MPRILIKVIRSERRKAAWDYIEPRVKMAMEQTVKPRLLGYFLRIAGRWDHAPEFKTRKVVTRHMLAVDVWPVGPNADIWRWLTHGTPRHLIAPRLKKVLKFMWGGPGSYKPKTGPGGRYKGPGETVGEVVHRASVMHPGVKPRRFEEAIARWAYPWFRPTMERAIQQGLRDYRRATKITRR